MVTGSGFRRMSRRDLLASIGAGGVAVFFLLPVAIAFVPVAFAVLAQVFAVLHRLALAETVVPAVFVLALIR